jgi:hypothetical protein
MNFWQFLRQLRFVLSRRTGRRLSKPVWGPVSRRRLPVGLGLELLEDRVVPSLLGPDGVTRFNEGDPTAKIRVALDIPSTKTVTVNYAVTGGTATKGVDFNLPPGKLTFAPGQTIATAPLGLLNDPVSDGNETIQVTLSNPVNANLQTTTCVYTIIDTAALPAVAFASATSSGPETQNGSLAVVLSAKSKLPITVAYAVTGGTGTAGKDYKPFSGTLTFKPGVTSQAITVPVLNDHHNGNNQTVQVTLSAPNNATLGATATTTYTIINTNPAPAVAFAAAAGSGPISQDASLTVTLSAPSDKSVTVNYTATGTAVAGTDYTLPSPQTVTFPAGSVSQTIPVHLIDSGKAGPNKTLILTLSGPAGATLGKTAAETFTIINNEPLPSVAFASATGSGPESKNGTLTVTLSAKSVVPVTVAYAVTGGTGTAGKDYKPFSGTLTFKPGVTSQAITVPVIDDHHNGNNQTVQVTLSSPGNAVLGATPTTTYTIVNDNPAPAVVFSAAAASGPVTQDASLTVTLSAPSDKSVTVNYVATGTAVAGTDYTLPSPQTVTFPAGSTSQTIPVHLIDSGKAGPNKTLILTLSGPAGATLGKTAAETFTIINNEPLPSVAFASATGSGPESKNGTLTVTLSAKSVVPVTVAYAVTGGTGTAGKDYKPFSGTLTFKPGVTSQAITVPVIDDHHNGNNQTVQVTLSSPSNAVLGTTTATTYTVVNDNPAPAANFSAAAGSGPVTQDASLTVTLSAPSDRSVTVNYTATGTAVAGTDYTLPSPQTVTFPAGSVSQTIPVHLIDSGKAGPNKTLILTLSGPAGATLGKTAAETFTIINNEPLPSVAFASATGSGPESKNGSLAVTLSAKSVVPVTVAYVVTGGTGTAGKDYKPFSGTLTFKPGVTSQAITVPVIDDHHNGNNQTVQVTLSAPGNAVLGTTTATTYTIVNDNPVPTVAFAQAAASNPQSLSAALVVTLSAPSDRAVTVNYVATGTAVAGTDYTLPSPQTVTFPAGSVHQTIPVNVINTGALGPNKTLILTLSGPAGVTLGKVSAETYTIIDSVTSTGFDLTPPTISVTSVLPGPISATNVTLKGTATDDFSGLASLTAAVDGGTPVALSVGAGGAFSFTTGLSLVAASDGTHTVLLTGTDLVGNVGTTLVSFVLDTTAPLVSITSPAAGFATNAASVTVAGSVDARVAGLASLTAAVDGGTPFAVTFDASGNFSFGAPTTGLADGTHSVTLSATDLAGNVGKSSVSFTFDTHPPTVTVSSPAPGITSATNITIKGQATDALSGVASMQESVDGGAFAPLSFDASGNFSFTTTFDSRGLDDGTHTVSFQATDKAGNVAAPVVYSFNLLALPKLSTPTLDPASDSGPSQTDGITNVTSPVVHVSAPTGLKVSLLLDGVSVGEVAAVGDVATFTVGPLADGPHTLVAARRGAGGTFHANSDPFTIHIITTPPTAPAFDLAPGTADLGPETTSAARVTLVGTADPGDTLTLVGTGLTALASATGGFEIPGVSLVMGANTLTVQASDLAGNTSSSSLTVTRGKPPTTPNAVIVWNQATLSAIQTDGTDPQFASRGMAMVQLAVFDSVNAIEGTPAYFVKTTAPAGASIEAAVDAAAHDVLAYLYPAQQATFDALYASQLALLPSGTATTDGVTVGQTVAAAVIARRANDGSRDFVDFEPGSAPGDWQPTPPAYAPALDPQWANVTPFALTGPSQFTPGGPPALSSTAWADAVNQVESLGAVNSTTRTADQTQIAQFWNDAGGTATPPGHWNAIAETVAQAQGDSLIDDARLFAELDVALADAGITAWNTKFTYTAWRPITVIQSGGDGVNSGVTADTGWYPLLTTPNFPEYVSGHSTFSAAAATVLDAFFGTSVSFSTTEPTLPGVTRSFTSFDQAAAEAGMSRIYAGIHFMFSNTDGHTAGQNVANWVLRTFNLSADTIPPRVSLDNVLPGGASNKNVTITGQATDNLSGVAALVVEVDGGAAVPLSFDAKTGNFSFTTSFALDGKADGQHTIFFRATDAAGNVSAPATFTFTLATQPPVVTLTSPTDGGTLATGDLLTGTATGEASLVSLGYAFDGAATPVSVAFNPADGSFSQALDLSKLATGPHTLAVTATDAAGNTTTKTLSLSLPAPVALTVTGVAPADGTPDVGVTFRPKVTFSRPIDTTTLTGANFFAADSTGAKIAATIVPADDGTYAWLFFKAPLPGASTITLTVDGSTIKAADGSKLDAAGSGVPGSKLTTTFTTVSETTVPGTTLSGIVADPGPDLQPMTRDDVRNGPDGILGTADDVYLLPIAGVKVYVLGHEDQAVFTDAQGRFSFASVPTGDVKLAIDGRTATAPPAGFFFPEMVMDLTIRPGVANTVMGSMGTTQEQAANATNLGVYLPRVATSILKPVSDTAPTTIGMDAAAAPQLTPAQRAQVRLVVQPNSLVAADGTKMSGGQVGVSMVPPALVKDMLPPGILQHSFDVTIQAPGVATFSTPVQMTLPNVFNAPPGTKLNFLSFDHTTGRLVIDGTATVSADGLSATTDPGSGVTHPGWHGLTPPGSQTQVKPTKPCGTQAAVILGLAAEGELGAGMYNITSGLFSGLKAAGLGAIFSEIPGLGIAANLVTGLGIGNDVVTSINAFESGDTGTGVLKAISALGKTALVGAGIYASIWALEFAPLVQGALTLYNTVSAFDKFSKAAANAKNYANDLNKMQTVAPCGGAGPSGIGPFASIDVLSQVNDLVQKATDEAPLLLTLHDVGEQLGILFQKADPTQPNVGLSAADLSQLNTLLKQYQDASNAIDSEGPVWNVAITIANELPGIGAPYTEAAEGDSAGPPTTRLYWAADLGSTVLRGVTSAASEVSFFAPADTPILVRFYDPASKEIGTTTAFTSSTGVVTNLKAVVLVPDTGPDADGDGLSDEAEFVIGTNPNKYSTAGDGISDGAKVAAGLDPLGNYPVPTGVVAPLSLAGSAQAVTLAGSALDARGQTAYVATGTYGLAIVDASQFEKPVVLGQIKLPGDSTAVAVDDNLKIAAVASNTGGLNLVDVSNPASPVLLRTITIDPGAVQVIDGVAYATDGNVLRAFDLKTGEQLDSLTTGTAPLTGLARDGSFLYAVDSGGTLQVIDASGLFMVARGSLNVGDSGNLFVGNGVAYVGAGSFGLGFAVADVSDPDHPHALPGGARSVAAGAVAANGSGLAVGVGSLPGLGSVFDLLGVSDPTTAPAFITRFTLPADPFGVAIGEGIAFVADGSSGLQVVNYLPLDTKGVAPTATISLPASDIVGTTAGGLPEVVEGSTVPVLTTTSDDVQVSNVQLLVNGTVVQNAVSFPFDLSAALPTLAAAGATTTVTLQVRATDTGGNVGLSPVLTIQLVKDTTPPALVGSNAPEGSRQSQHFHVLELQFSKPLDPTTVTASTFKLVGPGGTTIAPLDISFRHNNSTVQLTYPALAVGSYQVVIDAPHVTDLAGNVLGGAALTRDFSIQIYSAVWTNAAGGDWSDPTNWQSGVVPGPGDDVLIDVPGGATITFNSPSGHVHSILATNPLQILGGRLAVDGTLEADGGLQMTGGTLVGARLVAGSTGKLIVGDPSGVVFFVQAEFDGVTLASDLTVVQGANLAIGSGLEVDAKLTVEGGGRSLVGRDLTFDGTQTVSGTGQIVLGSKVPAQVGLTPNPDSSSAVLTLAAGVTLHGQGTIANAFGFIVGPGTGPGQLVNQGTIVADAKGDALTINVNLSNPGKVQVPDLAHLFLGGVLTLADLANITPTGTGNVRVTGIGAAIDNTGGTLALDALPAWLSFGPGGGIRNGTVTASGPFALPAGWDLTLDGVTFPVNFTIGTGTTLRLTGAWKWLGTISLTSGTLDLGGFFKLSDLGTLTRTGGTVNLTGGLNNAGTTLALDATTGSWNLEDGDIEGGTVTATGGAQLTLKALSDPLLFPLGFLDGVALKTDLVVEKGAELIVSGGMELDANLTVQGGSTFSGGDLVFSGTQTLSGTGQIVLGSKAPAIVPVAINSDGTPAVLTLGPGITLHGQGTVGETPFGFSTTSDKIVNQGLIAVDAGETLEIDSDVSNPGAITVADKATLVLGGTFTLADLAHVTPTGSGVVKVTGTLDNTGATLDLNTLPTWLHFAGGSIRGGTVVTGAGSYTLPAGFNMILNGVTLTGTVITGAGTTLGTAGSWSSTGALQVVGGILNLNGTFTTAGMGTVTQTSGTVNLTGTLDNTGATLTLTAATGSWNLYGTLKGGTYVSAGGALLMTSPGGTLDGVTLNSGLDLTADGAGLHVLDGLTLNKVTLLLGNAAGTTSGTLYFDNTETLGGTGTVLFGKSSGNLISSNTTLKGDTLTIGSGVTLRGSSGTIQSYPAFTVPGGTIVNQGTIAADDSGGAAGAYAYDNSFANDFSSFTGSTADAIDTSGVSSPAPQAVYQTYRTGSDFTYTLTGLKAGASYTLRLDFAEPTYTAAGQRVFNVLVNGTTALPSFDIFAAAGARDKAVAKSLAVTADGSGQIAVEFTYVSGVDSPLVNGIALTDSGAALVTAINCGELAGGTLTVNAGTFQNASTLAVSKGEELDVNGLTGKVGTATLSDKGSTLSLAGSGYTIDKGLTAAAGQTLNLVGTWTLPAGATITATGATLGLGDQNAGSTNVWTNAGTITATNSTVNLGGLFTLAGLGTFTRGAGSTVNLVGTLDASASGLALNATTGSWNLAGGTLKGGTYTASGGAELVFTATGGTLDGVTAGSDLDLTGADNPSVTVIDGLTLSGTTVRVGNAAGSTAGTLYFNNTETLGGTGTVLFGKSDGNAIYTDNGFIGSGNTLTIGSGITVRGSSGVVSTFGTADTIVNQGTIAADDSGGAAGAYAYDNSFGGGFNFTENTADAIDTSGVSSPAPQAVYQTYRSGFDFTYTLTGLKAGASYTLRLDFADPTATAAGQRVFDVVVNGTTMLSKFDIFAAAGAKDKAVAESLAVKADASGQIAVEFSYVSGQYALVNGLALSDSGGATVTAINCGLLAGGALNFSPTTFRNSGTLAVSNGETLEVSGLTGNLGTATLSGKGVTLSLAGSGYTIDKALTATAGQTLNLGGAWTLPAGQSITATGATLGLGDNDPNSTNVWTNAGTVTATNSTVNLGGLFTLTGLGTFTRGAGTTVNLVGTLDASASGLALNATTGSWNLAGGTLKGGTYSAAGGAELVFTFSGGTLDGVTAASDLNLTGADNPSAAVIDGLTLSGVTVRLGNAAGSTSGQLSFSGTQTLGGTGTVLFGKGFGNAITDTGSGDTLTIGPKITVRGSNGTLDAFLANDTIVNQGTIAADDSGGAAGAYAYDNSFSTSQFSFTENTADAIDTSGVSSPAPQAVYQTYRSGGDFTYTLTGLTAGASYTLRLDFADPTATAVGDRVFNVIVNGTTLLSKFDIFAAAGAKDKATAQSLAVKADAGGQIAVEFTYVSGSYDPLVNGIALTDSGAALVTAINCGELAGGTLTVSTSGTFQNKGTLAVSNGEALSVNGLTGNLGTATLSGKGSSLTLGGTGYTIDKGLTATAGQTLELDGAWTLPAGSTIGATGATLSLGDQFSSSANVWTNAGTISATNSTVNLGGSFTLAGLGTFTRGAGDTVNLVGTLDASASGLALTATTGSWNLLGGTLKGGTYSASGGAELVFTNSGGTLNGVTAASDLDLATLNSATATVVNGLTLSGVTVRLGNAAGSTFGELDFSGTQTLGGTGTVLFGKNGSNTLSDTGFGDTLTIGSGITLRGSSGTLDAFYSTNTIVNQGTIAADDSGGAAGAYAYDNSFSPGSFTQSTADVIDTSGVSSPAPQAVYQTYRSGGDFTYTLTGLTAGASYTLRLDFADPTATATGQRVFNVIVNGTTLLTNFDVFATAGGTDKATAQSLAVTADASGQVAVEFTYVSGFYDPLVNGIALTDSGAALVTAINCGELAGGTLTVSTPGTFQNLGTLAVSNGEAMSVNGLSGNLGIATLSGKGSSLTLGGSGYTIGKGLTATAGQTLELDGAWTLPAGSAIRATGATLSLGDQFSSSANVWTNAGTITATNSTVNLGGSFTLAGLGTFSRSGGTVNLVGTLDASASGLALTASTGSWDLTGGTLKGGTYSASGGAALVFTASGGTLDGVTAASDLNLTGADSPNVTVLDGLTLNSVTVRLGNAAGSTAGTLYFRGTQTLGGTGTVLFGKNSGNTLYDANSADTLTIGSGVTVRGSSGTLYSPYSNNTVINQGTISADDSGGLAGAYAYDNGFSGSSFTGNIADAIDTSGVSSPAPQAVYQTYRSGGDFTYTLTGLTAGASYTLRLDFADPNATATGQRVFNVNVNGTTLLSNFDVFAAAGAQGKATAQSLAVTADASGQIAVEFVYVSGSYNPLVNGIALTDSGAALVTAINCGELAGGTLTVNTAGTFQNKGTLAVSNGEALSVSGLSGNVGTATLSGTGSQLTLGGSGYTIDKGLTAAAGQTLELDGAWTLPSGSAISATGATLNLGDQSSSSTNAWTNAGTISATNSTVNLGGAFTLAGLGTFSRSGGAVNLVGTLDASASGLALNATTGSWDLAGGTLKGGTYSATGGAALVFTASGGTLDGVTAAGDLNLTGADNPSATVIDGLTLSGVTVRLGNAAGSTAATLYFRGTQTLGGTGTVLFGKNGSNTVYDTGFGDTLTLGSGITLRGSSGTLYSPYSTNVIVNQGTISADDSGGAAGAYAYDNNFSGGSAGNTADAIDTSAVTSPAPQAVYQTYRTGDFTYTLTGLTAGASYTLRLDFADPTSTATGQRVFNVTVNGATVLSSFDIFAAAGAKDKAVAESLAVTADATGQIAVAFAYVSGSYSPLVNGIALTDSGAALVTAINCGELAGGTLTVNTAGTFQNPGTLAVSNGEALSVSGFNGNVGTATISGSGSSLTLGGSGYTIDKGLTATAGQTLALNGAWTNAAASTISATGATLDLGDQNANSTNVWTNAGTISATGTTVNLGGAFTQSGLGTFSRSGGTVNLVGTLDGTGAGLALTAATGSWNLAGGKLKGGTYTATGGAELVFTTSGGTLDTVTAAGDLDLSQGPGVVATVVNGLTLSGATVRLGSDDAGTFNYGQLYFNGDQTLGGTGTVQLGSGLGSGNNLLYANGGTLTIASGVTVQGGAGSIGGNALVNQGTITAGSAGATLSLTAASVTNQGTMRATGGGTLAISNFQPNAGTLYAGQGSTIAVSGNLTQAAGGAVSVEVGGTDPSLMGQVTVTGTATLAGTLNVVLAAGYLPASGDSFPILTCGSLVGTFDTITGLMLSDGRVLNAVYSATGLTLVAP